MPTTGREISQGQMLARRAFRGERCPECGQPPGHRCLGVNGKARKTPHQGRLDAATTSSGGYKGVHATRVTKRQMTPEEIEQAFG